MLGVNVNRYEAKQLKPAMDKEKLNWRSFADGRAISEKWNAATPGYYVIDPQGVIRSKWVGNPGAKAIDAALEKLIHEAEGSKPETGSRPASENPDRTAAPPRVNEGEGGLLILRATVLKRGAKSP